MKVTSEEKSVYLTRSSPTEELPVEVHAPTSGNYRRFLAHHVIIGYVRENGSQWRWKRISVSGRDRHGKYQDHHWDNGSSQVPLWAIGLAYQYYPKEGQK